MNIQNVADFRKTMSSLAEDEKQEFFYSTVDSISQKRLVGFEFVEKSIGKDTFSKVRNIIVELIITYALVDVEEDGKALSDLFKSGTLLVFSDDLVLSVLGLLIDDEII